MVRKLSLVCVSEMEEGCVEEGFLGYFRVVLFYMSSVYYGVKHIIICEALPLSWEFSIYVLYILQQKVLFFFLKGN